MSLFVDLDQTRNWFVVYTPFRNDPFVVELKALIPAASRQWLPEARAWCVTRTYWQTTEELLKRHYRDVSILYGPDAEEARTPVREPIRCSYAVLGLLSDAPDCVIHAAYQALATASELPVQTRQAYEEICSHRGIDPRGPEEEEGLEDEDLDGDNRSEDLAEDEYEQEYQDEWQ